MSYSNVCKILADVLLGVIVTLCRPTRFWEVITKLYSPSWFVSVKEGKTE